MSQAHAKDAARPRQPKSNSSHMDFANAVYVASVTGVPIMPDSGKGDLSAWAKLFCVDRDTVKDMFEEADLPYERWNSLRFYRAEDVSAAKKPVTKATDPDYSRHGGKRVSKKKKEE